MATITKLIKANGTPYFKVRIRLRGHLPATGTFDRLTDARAWAQRTEASMAEGRYFRTAEAQRHTLAELIDRYIENEVPKHRTNQAKITMHLMWWKHQLGHMILREVTPPVIAEARDRLMRSPLERNRAYGKSPDKKRMKSPATVVHYMAALSHAFSIAMREWLWVEDNPVLKVRKPKLPRGRVPYQLYELNEPLAQNAAETVDIVYGWYDDKDSLFQFRGGRLLAIIFPKFTPDLSAKLIELLKSSTDTPTLLALSHVINKRKKAYYQALERANKGVEVTEWLIYFAKVILEAQEYSLAQINFILAKTKLYDRLRGQLNQRQEKVLDRMFREGIEGFKGGLSAKNYQIITGASPATTTRDLTHLVELGVLRREGELRGTRYHLACLPGHS